jgi:hypothetical protein
MRSRAFFSLLILLCGCSSAPEREPVSVVRPTNEARALEANAPNESNNWTPQDEVVELFVTIADTSDDYHAIDARLHALARRSGAEVDTMGRYFDRERKALILPEDDPDDLYAGDYVPRRFEGSTLSIEYLDLYTRQAGDSTFALVTGLWSTETEADSALAALRTHAPAAFKLSARVYQGCMH